MKIGARTYDLGTAVSRGRHETGNLLFPESNIIVRDYSGLYASNERRHVDPAQVGREMTAKEPQLERDEPELER